MFSFKSHPVEGVMMQPPRSTVILQPQPRSGVSWFMPKLCPSSCAKVTAAPSGFSEWSCEGGGEHENMLILCNLVHLKCESQSYLSKQLWLKSKPYWSHSPKKRKKKERKKESSKKTISNSADSQNSSVAFRSLLLLILLMEAWIHLPFHYPYRPNHTRC